MTERPYCAVIGHPVAHSLSPALHRAAYRQLGIDWDYLAVDVAPDGLDEFVEALPPHCLGLSVTMPHKAGIRRHGRADDRVELTGVANTLVRGRAPGVYNTDVAGFVRAFGTHGISSLESATLIGAGATARSAAVSLRELGVERLVVMVRSPERAAGLQEFVSDRLGMVCDVRRLVPDQVVKADAVVSTVPAGGSDVIANELAASADVVFDAVYDPWPTQLAAAAQLRDVATIDGLDLLAGQAIDQIRLFTGHEVELSMLRSAGQEELRRRASV